MSEFNNRISAQRKILYMVNSRAWQEELFSLASKAIDRWLIKNQLDSTCRLAVLVREAGAKLFFLANKSQEQVTEDYAMLVSEVAALSEAIQRELKCPS
ncbi:hypothetical protein [Massilia cavernae]|uniref:Four helix bundle protein n=1 Tax=Massilia cavernae TaxID=2320864 RepID=A0A418Y612_9BURK|nr:hypothetical protein [Massilia cavernae]RJG22523.1 hypothetical protein D3872_05350 [Massilia cavernae]